MKPQLGAIFAGFGALALMTGTAGAASPVAMVEDVSGGDLARHRFFDFAARGRALTGGGLYRTSFGSVSVIFRLARTAGAGALPPMTRLLQL